jgi:hypothetical protein
MAAVAVAVLIVSSGAALAKTPPPKAKNSSAISQYRESIPTASGPAYPVAEPPPPPPPPSASAPAPVEPPPPPPAPALTPKVQQAVERKGGKDAKALVRAATDSRLGAPATLLPAVPVTPDRPSGAPNAVLSGAGRLVTDGQSGRVVALVVVMIGLAVAAGAAAGLRRRVT